MEYGYGNAMTITEKHLLGNYRETNETDEKSSRNKPTVQGRRVYTPKCRATHCHPATIGRERCARMRLHWPTRPCSANSAWKAPSGPQPSKGPSPRVGTAGDSSERVAMRSQEIKWMKRRRLRASTRFVILAESGQGAR
jgi:hypothetical protein